MKLLMDTNVIIHLEDAREVMTHFSDLQRKCQEHGVDIFVHEASLEDIRRDKDEKRRKVTLSKIKKFQQLKGVHAPADAELAALYGKLTKPNDVCDAKMLYSVGAGVVDVFVTEDDGIHRRAKAAGLSDQVLTVADALTWIRHLYEPEQVFLPSVQAVKAYGVNFEDKIFAELASDYDGFDVWVAKCKKEHRDCWMIMDGKKIAGIVIRKDEGAVAAGTKHGGPKILKICTFKVSEDYRGQKLGEQLLKQILWFAQRNRYDLTYLTVFEKQEALIRLIEEYGFERTLTRPNGELVFEKPIGHGALAIASGQSVLAADRKNYPRFADVNSVRKFVVPIRPGYHAKLFPEVTAPPAGTGNPPGGKPGNTIKKVYICHAPTEQMRPGDLLFFYMTKSRTYGAQSITSIGVVESVRRTSDVAELRRWTAKRSVFSDAELAGWVQADRPLKVIDFLLIGHLEPTVSLAALTHEGIMVSWPQSITLLSPVAYGRLKPFLNLGFNV